MRRADRPRFGQMVWKYGWGLIFVCMMTALFQCAPHLGICKVVGDAAPIVSPPLTHVVK